MRSRWLIGGCAVALLAATVGAQTVPIPKLPTEPAPEPSPLVTTPQGPAPLAVEPEQREPRWEYELTLSTLWDSNINFLVPEGPSDATVVPRARLARTFTSPRGRLSLGGEGHWIGYVNEKNFNRWYGEFDLDGSYDTSPRTHWEVNGSYSLGYSDSSLPLLQQGVLLPLVETRTLTGAVDMSHQIGDRSQLRVDGRIYAADFDDPLWVDGTSLRGTLAIERQLGSRNTIGFVYAAEGVLSDEDGGSYLTHFGSLQWTRIFSPRTGITLEGGASYTPSEATAALAQPASFFGGLSLTRQTETTNLTAFVRREVAPAFGAGVSRLETRGGLNADLTLGRHWALRLSGIHVQPDNTDLPGSYAASDDATISLGRRLGRRLEISGDASYRRRGASGTLAEIDGFQAGVSLTLGPARVAR